MVYQLNLKSHSCRSENRAAGHETTVRGTQGGINLTACWEQHLLLPYPVRSATYEVIYSMWRSILAHIHVGQPNCLFVVIVSCPE
jgi:hypothetical protein